jgi:hypothetical protein
MNKRKQKAIVERQLAGITRPVAQPSTAQPGGLMRYYIEDWLRSWVLEAPRYQPDSRLRDRWLTVFSRIEPNWCAALGQMAQLDSGRKWTLTGGRNQVRQGLDILHNAQNGDGWRAFIQRASIAFRTSDLGAVVRVYRDGAPAISAGLLYLPPLTGLEVLDSTQCCLTTDQAYPLTYGVQKLAPWEFFRICENSSILNEYQGLGYCATSVALEYIKLAYAVLRYDQEGLGARIPQEIITLSGITEEQWADAMTTRNTQLDALDRQVFGGAIVFGALPGVDEPRVTVTPIIQPADFNRESLLTVCRETMAAALGMDMREFWPVSSGAMGTATETETQHRKAASKGTQTFTTKFQEALQRELPPALKFVFEERDAEGELLDAQVNQEKVAWIRGAYEAGMSAERGALTAEQYRTLLVQNGLIPSEWTLAEEESTADDETPLVRALPMARAVLAQNPSVTITDEDVDRAIVATEKVSPLLAGLMAAEVV